MLKIPGGRTVLAAYDWCLKSSHAFNVLDARGAISVSQRAGMILSIRKLACAIAAAYVAPPGEAEAVAWSTPGSPRQSRAWLSARASCSSRSAARRCPRPGCPAWPSSSASASRRPRAASSSSPTDVQVFRRRAGWCSARRVLARQADREEPVWGPSLKVAKDAAGKWTGAAQGFAKKNGVAVDALQDGAKDPAKPDELYLLFTRKTAGRAAGEVLPAVIAATLRGLDLPEAHELGRLARRRQGRLPVRPADPLAGRAARRHGRAVRDLRAGRGGQGQGPWWRAGRQPSGHRFLPRGAAGKPLTIRSLAELREALRTSFVLLDPAERAARIAKDLAAVVGRRAWPTTTACARNGATSSSTRRCVAGEIPAEFRTLPREVLETVLVHHQKYIPLGGRGRALVARFAAVTNTDGAAAAEIVRGMERVVVARLRDAAFFFAEDRKRPLADRVADLAGVTFHQNLGSYQDKAERMARLVDAMGASWAC